MGLRYSEIMRELGIEIISPNESQKTIKKPVFLEKSALKIRTLREISKAFSYLTFLRYYKGFYYANFQKTKVRTNPKTLKFGGYSQ